MAAALLWGSVAAVGVGGAYCYIIRLATLRLITIGDVAMYSGAVFYGGAAIRSMIQSASALWSNLLESYQFLKYVESEAQPNNGKASSAIPIGRRGTDEWLVEHVSFSYSGRLENAVADITFSVKAGEKVAIVGSNGAGKTTLMKLMLGLLPPEYGSVWFRGIELRDWNLSSLRNGFGVVFQDSAKFKLTLTESIDIALPPGDLCSNRSSLVQDAARIAGADEIAKKSRLGYKMQLGGEFPNGTDLSGGEWYRIALARGFVRNASVIFLDEPSASLDPKAEQKVFEQVLCLAQNRTTILISHRLSITPLVDRILVLDHGRLIEQGTHKTLMRLDGHYAQLYRTQAEMYWPSTR